MLISVNICLYNSKKYIQETLDSVFAQTYQNFEIIAIDDGSTDGTYEFIKEKYIDPRLKLYRQENHGLSYTRNKCAELSSGEYIAFLDHDDIWVPTKLEQQVEAIRKSKYPPALVFGDYQLIDQSGTAGKILRVNDGIILSDNFFETTLNARRNIVGLSSVMLEKKLWDIGIARFDSCYRMAEEYDVWLKASMANPHYAYVPSVLYYYRIHGENTSLKMAELLYLEPIIILQNLLPKANKKYHKLLKLNIKQFYINFAKCCYAKNRSNPLKVVIESFKYNISRTIIFQGIITVFINYYYTHLSKKK